MMTLQVLHHLHRHHDHLVLESLDAACWAVLRLAQATNLIVYAPIPLLRASLQTTSRPPFGKNST